MTLKQEINRKVGAIANSLGFDITRQRPVGLRRQALISEHGIITAIDVGANCGQYGCELREFGFIGRIISLEPLAAPFNQLSSVAASDGSWDIFKAGASDRPEIVEMNVASNSVSSSVLEMAELHESAAPNSKTVGREQVELVRLDSGLFSVEASSPILLKLDIQGHELAALEGASGLLGLTELIEMEVSVRELYKGQPLVLEAANKLNDLGFQLVALEQVFIDPTTGAALQFDATFTRR